MRDKVTYQNKTLAGEAHYGRKRGRKLYRYDVVLDGATIGTVEQVERATYRMAGRLIARTFHPLEWAWQPAGDLRLLRLFTYSRDAAADRLIDDLRRREVERMDVTRE